MGLKALVYKGYKTVIDIIAYRTLSTSCLIKLFNDCMFAWDKGDKGGGALEVIGGMILPTTKYRHYFCVSKNLIAWFHEPNCMISWT